MGELAMVLGASMMLVAVVNPSARKVGGIWFVRIGRVRLSFCRVRSES